MRRRQSRVDGRRVRLCSRGNLTEMEARDVYAMINDAVFDVENSVCEELLDDLRRIWNNRS